MTCIYIHMAKRSLHFLLLTVEVIALGQLLTVSLLSEGLHNGGSNMAATGTVVRNSGIFRDGGSVTSRT
jgi:hypothetical protein